MKKPCLKLVMILVFASTLVSLRAGAADDAAAVLARYLKMSLPDEDRRGEARLARYKTLEELKATPESSVREIIRMLPGVQDPRQRAELAETLRNFPTKESAAKLGELLDDPDDHVRVQAIYCLRLMARRVDRFGGKRTQRGAEFPPAVDGLVPTLIKAAGDKAELNRISALYALADTQDPAAVAELRRRLKDENAQVRLNAACLLTEFKDATGLPEMKAALGLLRSGNGSEAKMVFNREGLLASFERITGKSFGEIPMNPVLSSSTTAAAAAEKRYQELLDAWAEWFASHPDFR